VGASRSSARYLTLELCENIPHFLEFNSRRESPSVGAGIPTPASTPTPTPAKATSKASIEHEKRLWIPDSGSYSPCFVSIDYSSLDNLLTFCLILLLFQKNKMK